MTREDAKYILSELMKSLNEYCGLNDTGFKAFNMAIKALEQESCEDAVSRKDVIGGFCDRCDTGYCNSNKCFKIEWIRDLPSVTPKPKTGKL